jgi:hypothetical protein
MQRYGEARAKSEATWHAEVANTPIDDAAWECELRWRHEINGGPNVT